MNLAWTYFDLFRLSLAQSVFHRDREITFLASSFSSCASLASLATDGISLSGFLLKPFRLCRSILLRYLFWLVLTKISVFKQSTISRRSLIKHFLSKIMQNSFIVHVFACVDSLNRSHRILMISHLIYFSHPLENVIDCSGLENITFLSNLFTTTLLLYCRIPKPSELHPVHCPERLDLLLALSQFDFQWFH